MHSYGFLLDENVAKLKGLFPRNRAKTVYDFELDGRPDREVIKKAGDEGLILVTADAGYVDFFREVSGRRKRGTHLHGLMLIVPTDLERQKRLFPLNEIEKRMRLNSLAISWPTVSDNNLLVRIQEPRRVNVDRLPPCPCQDAAQRKMADKALGKVLPPFASPK